MFGRTQDVSDRFYFEWREQGCLPSTYFVDISPGAFCSRRIIRDGTRGGIGNPIVGAIVVVVFEGFLRDESVSLAPGGVWFPSRSGTM
jgi:hypothetical protein